MTPDRAVVEAILRDALAYEWRMQGIGLLGRWLDNRREYRLHVWAPDRCVGDSPVHDHPFDFESTIVVGEMGNTRYVEAPRGDEYVRARYLPGAEGERTVDSVRLVGTTETIRRGETYSQRATELHDSRQLPGTVSIIRMTFVAPRALSVCSLGEAPEVEGAARPATPDEISEITGIALSHFD